MSQLLAHHSVTAGFDPAKAKTIQGIFTRVEWVNPHTWITMEVKDFNSQTTTWHVETAAAGALFKDGIRYEDLEMQNPARWKSGRRVMDQEPPTAGG